MNYYKRPQECIIASQAEAQKAMNAVKKTDLKFQLYMMTYDYAGTDIESPCWIAEAGEAKVIIPVFDGENLASVCDCKSSRRIETGEYFLRNTQLCYLGYDVIEGCIIRQIHFLYTSSLVDKFASLRGYANLVWIPLHLFHYNRYLGIFWHGCKILENLTTEPVAFIPVWEEDGPNLADCPLEEIDCEEVEDEFCIRGKKYILVETDKGYIFQLKNSKKMLS